MLNVERMTKIWRLYEAGKTYNANIGDGDYYETIDTNIDFYHGRQWRGIEDTDFPQPSINVLKRVTSYHIANLNTDDINALIEPLEYNYNTDAYQAKDEQGNLIEVKPEEVHASELVSAEINNLMEKLNFKHRLRDVVTDSAITGDGCLHWYFDTSKKPYRGKLGQVEGEICVEIVDGQNVMFGNANNRNVDEQPYILVVGRDLVSNLKREARTNKNNTNGNEIKPDNDYNYMAGEMGKHEVDAEDYKKALYVIKYERDIKTGKIKMSKSTQTCEIFTDIDTGLDYYPICWLNWERQKNCYHGISHLTSLIPNQICINQMFAYIMYHQKMGAFPNRIIDGDRIPFISNEIGADIIVNGLMQGESVSNLVHNLEPTNMSPHIMKALEMMIQYTKEMLGMNDSAMGNINNPENTSAIMTNTKNAMVPLQNIKANVDEFVEDNVKVMIDMIATYYGERPIAIKNGKARQLVEYDFSRLKGMWLSQKVEVGNTTQYSEIAQIQTLTNLLQTKDIDLRTFVERIPNNVFPKREELLQKLEQQDMENAQVQQDFEFVAQFIEQHCTPEQQQIFQQMMEQRKAA